MIDREETLERIQEFEAKLKTATNPTRRASLLYQIGKLRSAICTGKEEITNFREAIKLNPNWLEPYFELAQAYFKYGEIDKGIVVLRELIKRGKKRNHRLVPRAHFLLGLRLVGLGKIEEGVREYKEALKAKDILFRQGVAFHLSCAMRMLGEEGEAKRWWNFYIGRAPVP